MDDVLLRAWTDLLGRWDGPLAFRCILQPLMASLYAWRDGVKDARLGRPPYFWAILSGEHVSRELLHEGVAAVGRVIALGVIMDVIYQVMVFKRLYPGELVVIVLLLAFVPHLLLRGPINRIARFFMHSRSVT